MSLQARRHAFEVGGVRGPQLIVVRVGDLEGEIRKLQIDEHPASEHGARVQGLIVGATSTSFWALRRLT